MNNRNAKRIRRAARRLTVGMTERSYQAGEPPVYIKTLDPEGREVVAKFEKGKPTRLADACTRAVTQKLKRHVKREQQAVR